MRSAIPYPIESIEMNGQSSTSLAAPAGKPGWIPSQPPDGFTGKLVDKGNAGTVPVPLPTGNNVTDYVRQADIHTFPYLATGKVYFTMSRRNYVCSGSVIGENTIWTAAHCV